MNSKKHISKKYSNFLSMLLLLSFGLQLLPDRLMDIFHEHEHTHECHPNQPGEFTIEKEHIHCKFPDLFFKDFDHRIEEFKFKITVCSAYNSGKIFQPILTKRYQLKGRAPPSV